MEGEQDTQWGENGPRDSSWTSISMGFGSSAGIGLLTNYICHINMFTYMY